MQNQDNKKYTETLLKCRKEIDEIDLEILDLLQKRMSVVHEVKRIKDENGENFYIKSAREADMIKNLVKKSAPNLPKSLIISIWRKIITSSNMFEQPLKIALHNPNKIADYKYILQQYYADYLPVGTYENVSEIVLDIEKNNAQIAAFALPSINDEDSFDDGKWWINLANDKSGLKVFAKIPFSNLQNSPNLVLLAKKELEESSDDATLLCVEQPRDIPKSAISKVFEENSLEFKILKSTQIEAFNDSIFHLIEVSGFFDQESLKIKALNDYRPRFFAKVLGVYAK